jgi:hypothetical protein
MIVVPTNFQESFMRHTKTNRTAEQAVQSVLSESVLSLRQAQEELLQSTGIRPDKATIIRWIMKGRQGVKLAAVKVGNQWITSSESLHKFIVATTAEALA